MTAAPHRKDDNNGDHRAERSIDATHVDRELVLKLRLWHIATLISLAFVAGGASLAYKLERDQNKQRYEELRHLLTEASFRPDQWTGTNMYELAATFKEWNPQAVVPNPLDIQAGRRARKLTLPEVSMNP